MDPLRERERTRETIKSAPVLFKCVYCNKNYVRKTSYNNHLLSCKYARVSSTNNSRNKPDCMPLENLSLESLSKDVTIHNLFAMVIMLHNKYDKLESDYNELKKYVNITKNKINILDYLNEKFKHDYLSDGRANITKFMDNLLISEEHLQKIFKYDYVDGIFNIICDYIDKLNLASSLLPIKCFNTKENVLYIFDGLEWLIMDDNYLRKFIKSFDKKILTMFVEWKKIAEKSIDPEIFGEIYIQNMKKVIGGNYEKKNPAFMIKSRLYKHLKVDLKSIVHYDFV
jgi:hypothetical protein